MMVLSAAAQRAPVPTRVTLTPEGASLPNTAVIGTFVAAASVTMSDGSAFRGQYAPFSTSFVTMSGNNVVLDRALTSADNGRYQWGVFATENNVTVTTTVNVTIG